MSKIIEMLLIRHAKRKGRLLSEQGISDACDFGKELTKKHIIITSQMPWSIQTGFAIACGSPASHIPFGADERLSPEYLIEVLFTPEVIALEKSGMPTLLAIDRALPREVVAKAEEDLANGIRQIIARVSEMPRRHRVVVVHHDPYLQLAIRGMGGKIPGSHISLKELDGWRSSEVNGILTITPL